MPGAWGSFTAGGAQGYGYNGGSIGSGKSVAAAAAGALCTLIVGGLQMGGVTLPAEMAAAIQTLITLAAVYVIPHST